MRGIGSGGTRTTAALGSSKFRGDFAVSARVRGGYATEKFYFYGMLGLAATDAGVRPSNYTDTDILVGGEIGIGAEMALQNGWSTRLDVTHSNLDGQNYTFNGTKKGVNFNMQTISIGVVKRF